MGEKGQAAGAEAVPAAIGVASRAADTGSPVAVPAMGGTPQPNLIGARVGANSAASLSARGSAGTPPATSGEKGQAAASGPSAEFIQQMEDMAHPF